MSPTYWNNETFIPKFESGQMVKARLGSLCGDDIVEVGRILTCICADTLEFSRGQHYRYELEGRPGVTFRESILSLMEE